MHVINRNIRVLERYKHCGAFMQIAAMRLAIVYKPVECMLMTYGNLIGHYQILVMTRTPGILMSFHFHAKVWIARLYSAACSQDQDRACKVKLR